MSKFSDLLEYIISNIVDEKDRVEIKEELTEDNFLDISIKVAPDDIGKIIGKEGRTIKAIRKIAYILAVKENQKNNISVDEN